MSIKIIISANKENHLVIEQFSEQLNLDLTQPNPTQWESPRQEADKNKLETVKTEFKNLALIGTGLLLVDDTERTHNALEINNGATE